MSVLRCCVRTDEKEMFQTYVVEKVKMHCMFNKLFFENCVVCDVTSKNIVLPDKQQMTIWLRRIACWIPKATDTLSGCVILIAFPLQQWLHERTSILRFKYIDWLVS